MMKDTETDTQTNTTYKVLEQQGSKIMHKIFMDMSPCMYMSSICMVTWHVHEYVDHMYDDIRYAVAYAMS
jgi:hypothetical protein